MDYFGINIFEVFTIDDQSGVGSVFFDFLFFAGLKKNGLRRARHTTC